MSLAFQNGQAAASVERPIDASNPYPKGSRAYFDFRHGHKTAPVYGVTPPPRTRREEACSIRADDAVSLLKPPVQWGRPIRAVAWFHDASGQLYAICAEWDDQLLGRTRRMQKVSQSRGRWRIDITSHDLDEKGSRA
jgi:hypothetical protein